MLVFKQLFTFFKLCCSIAVNMILGTRAGLAAAHAGKGRVQDQGQRDSKTVTQNFVKN
jgi:hypothetical protein